MIKSLGKYRQLIAVFLLELFVTQLVWAYKSPSKPSFYIPDVTYHTPLSDKVFKELANSTFDKGKKQKAKNIKSIKNSIKDDIGGPGQPEMNSFKSINSNNMVDLFTGDFSYQIPLMDVGGYPVNIHYNSGVSMDQEASWVGLGWNINPGTIGRTTRGLPDDFNGTDSIVRTQSIKENRTIGATISANAEIKGRSLPFTLGFGAFHNNYNGWGTEAFISPSINLGRIGNGYLNGGISLSNNSQSGLDVQPSLSFALASKDKEWNGSATLGTNYNSRSGISGLQLNTEVRQNVTQFATARDMADIKVQESIGFGVSSSISFATPSYLPTVTMPMTNHQFSFKLKPGSAAWTWFPHTAILGYVSQSEIAEIDKRQVLPAYGYLYFSKNKSARSLLDFNREKEVAFNAKTTPHIAIPQYTYDVYSISGEGITGSFRPYRGDIGYIYDHSVGTKSGNSKLNVELGFGQYFHAGVDFDFTSTVTQTGAWTQSNELLKNLKYQTSDSTFEEVYFRNPGEKSINAGFQTSIGSDSLMSVKLSGSKTAIKAESVFTKYSKTLTPSGEVLVTSPLYKPVREKRSQVITYLKAGEAAKIGLDTVIQSFPLNSIPLINCNKGDTVRRVGGIRKEHHLSEIDVLNPDGRRYIYGLPAYNISQQDVIFSVAPNNEVTALAKGLTGYATADDTKDNKKGKDNYYMSDSTPAHAHSFLLTGILSPDYVDLKGDGITEDDLGDGVKFNYSQVYGELKNNPFNWRTPSVAGKANYNEGLKTYNRDDKGTYLYGSKEVWYLNSVESKTMIAVFKVSDREDVYSVTDQTGAALQARPLKKLDSIELYTKADLLNDPNKARPIKTVHFIYEASPFNQLCRGGGVDPIKGKLTLKKIWFSYNKNYKGEKNPYVFSYHPQVSRFGFTTTGNNPDYNPKAYDRWGNYKSDQLNPGGLSNSDYPYTIQDSALTAQYASAWHLTDIKLPSGGKITVKYEADDYGFVQNKRAVQMFQLAGFGNTITAWPSNKLYTSPSSSNDLVFVNSVDAMQNKRDVYKHFLQGLEDRDGILKLYFKIAVRMPYENDTWSTPVKYEMVPTYAEVEDYDVVPGNSKRFWIRLKKLGGSGVLTKAALQFLKLNLPSKAYPSSEIGDDVSVGQVVKTLASGWQEIKNAVDGFDDQQKKAHHCETVEVDKSFVRLGSPNYKKYGGGLRVKRIEIADNWKAMTGQKESIYGQEYTYTTSYVRAAGDTVTISSGVAAYEPMIGGEENAFRLPIEYTEKVAPLAPTNFLYTEAPLGESFFPSPMIGYSKVRVRTINAKAKSANGWTETEFYTTKDFPTVVDNTPIDKKSYNPKFNILRINAIHHLTVSQGFRIELNDMNGKTKAESIYAENDPVRPIHYSASFYKVENDLSFSKRLSNTVWAVDSSSGHINKQAEIGKDVEIMVDVREQKSNTLSGNLGVNLDFTPAPFIPPFFIFPSSIPLPQREESRFRSIAVTKIVNRYGILDSMIVIDKGSVVTTKNLVFDGETGQALVSRTNNEYNDPVYNFSYPARWAYSGMGMAYENIGLRLRDKKFINGRLIEKDETTPSPAIKFFESGDEVWLLNANKASATAQTTTDCAKLNTTNEVEGPTKKIWAIEAAKGKEKDQGIYFIDETGSRYSGDVHEMRIIRSGKRNMTDAFVGAITSLVNPVRDISATESRIVIDLSTKPLNATTATFKDFWKVDNSLYQIDSCYTRVKTETFQATGKFTLLRQRLRDRKPFDQDIFQDKILNYSAAVASFDRIPNGGNNGTVGRRFYTKGILQFDFQNFNPRDAVITSATLNFFVGNHGQVWPPLTLCNPCNSNFNWAADDKGYRSEYNSLFRRIPTPWNSGTSYDNFGTTAENQVLFNTVPSSNPGFLSLSATELIKDVLERKKPYYGFMFQLQNPGNFTNVPHFYSLSNFIKFGNTLEIVYQSKKDTCVKLCRNNITDTVNPYRWGILGNWRTDQTIVYYADRIEKNASTTQTNIRNEGVLKDFTPYWSFTSTGLKATTDTTKWVWNSASSLYNRKGVEIENYDPLGRYNAGLYGYNQTLPIAVAQNSKYREILFDGFEDYNYRTRNCDAACVERDIDFLHGNSAASIYGTESHTGKSSLLIAQNQQAVFAAPVIADTAKSQLSFELDSSAITTTSIVGKGQGLSATYACYDQTNWVTKTEGPIDFVYNSYAGSLPSNCSNQRYKGVWTGKLQPKYSDVYTFTVNTPQAYFLSSGAGITITDPTTNNVVLYLRENVYGGVRSATTLQALQAGKLYDISVSYPLFYKSVGEIHLSWSSYRQAPEIISQGNFYPSNMVPSDSSGSVVTTVQKWCVSATAAKPKNVIVPKFSPLQGKRMTVIAWMKTPGYCTTTASTPSQVQVGFLGDAGAPLLKTGLPVEGWQRYEADITVPKTTTQIYLVMTAGSNPLLIDDIRVQPYNSNMKAFVYDPVNLRLMSELDENNYASFYEYDDDGTLVRVKKETEKGIQTIKETRTALIKN